MNYRDYMRIVEETLGEIQAADGIREEQWFEVVMKRLDDLSRRSADELEQETGKSWVKPTGPMRLHEAPPTRLLGLCIILAAWLGWVMYDKHDKRGYHGLLSAADCWKRIREAFEYGVSLSKQRERP